MTASAPPASSPAVFSWNASRSRAYGICPSVGSLVPGPTEPSTYRGRCGVDQRSATSRAIRAPASDSSRMRCSMPYSPRLPRFAPNVLVSTQSAPAARYASCTPATTSGRVTLSTSLQPSCPSKSSRARSAACSMVPIAPSATRTRSARASNSESGTVLRLSDAARRRLRG